MTETLRTPRRNAYLTIVPTAESSILLGAIERFVPNRRLDSVGIETRRGISRPDEYLPVLKVVSMERFADTGHLTVCMKRAVELAHNPSQEVGRVDRLNLSVDVSHETTGPVAAARIYEIARALGPRCRLAIIDLSTFELTSEAERRGWRVAVGRRLVVSTLVEHLQEGRLKIEFSGPLLSEVKVLLDPHNQSGFAVRPSKEDGFMESEAVGRAIALTAWAQKKQPRTSR